MSDYRERLGLGRRALHAGGAITAAVAVCLAAAGCSGATPGTLLAPHQVASAAPPTVASRPPLTGPPADPFTGSPADGWADGSAGIVLPTAKAAGPFTTAQVESAYETTRKLLIAGYLDQKTLNGGAPTAFSDLLTNPQRTQFFQGLNKTGVDKQGYLLSTRGWVMSFWPGSAKLIGSVIKVHGAMSARATTDDGSPELDVNVDYIFVYPIEPPLQPYDWMRIVTEVSWNVDFGHWEGVAATFAPWVATTGNGGVAGAQCTPLDGYVHPDYPDLNSGVNPSSSPSGPPLNPYELGQSRIPGCQATTGT